MKNIRRDMGINFKHHQEVFTRKLLQLKDVYDTSLQILGFIQKYLGKEFDVLADGYDRMMDDDTELLSECLFKLKDKLWLSVDIYHPSIDSPTCKIEIIPSVDNNEGVPDWSSNVLVIEIHGLYDFSVTNQIDETDEFFNPVEDKELMKRIGDLGTAIMKESGRWN